jgi:cell division protein ZipA
MDPDLLRLLLVVLGVLLVLGIYLWDRYQRAVPPARNRRVIEEPTEPGVQQDTPATRDHPADADPYWDDPIGSDWREGATRGHAAASRASQQLDPDPDPAAIAAWSTTAAAEEPQLSMGLRFDAHGDADYLSADPDLQDDVERKLIVIHVASRHGSMAGPAIEQACAAADLELGDMSIYHRRDAATGQVLFSVASMVEPGSFPRDGMAQFRTPGLVLFSQLPGAREGTEIYEAMLEAAAGLATRLQAEVQDEHRNKLTRQMQDHMRESIIEHRRKVRLARSRH